LGFKLKKKRTHENLQSRQGKNSVKVFGRGKKKAILVDFPEPSFVKSVHADTNQPLGFRGRGGNWREEEIVGTRQEERVTQGGNRTLKNLKISSTRRTITTIKNGKKKTEAGGAENSEKHLEVGQRIKFVSKCCGGVAERKKRKRRRGRRRAGHIGMKKKE